MADRPYSGAVASEALDSAHASTGLRVLVNRDALGALVLAGSIPFLFLHERYQPDLSVGAGTTTVDIRLSDLAVLVVVAFAAAAAARTGVSHLRAARALWISGAALLVWLAFQTFRPVSLDDARFDEHLVSFLKLVEYSLLAVAVPLLVRRAADLTIVLGGLVLWAGVAVGVALLQFFGVDIFGAWNPGWRQPSFLTHHDLAATLRCRALTRDGRNRFAATGAAGATRSSRWHSAPESSGSSWRGR